MSSAARSISNHDWGLLALLSVLWGGSYLFAGIAVRELPPLVVVLARVSIAALVLVPFHVASIGALPADRRSWLAFAGMSILNNVVPFSLIVSGQALIASGLASVINATTPLFTILVMALFREEPLRRRAVFAVLLGLAGVAVLRSPGLAAVPAQFAGILLCLAAAASYGFAALWARRRLRGIAPLTSATGQLVCSTVFMVPLAFAGGEVWTLLQASWQCWAALVGFALLSTALAYVVFFRIVARSGPSTVMLVTLMIPVPAILFGYAVLGETLTARELAGALIIGCALLIIDGRAFARFSRWAKNPAR